MTPTVNIRPIKPFVWIPAGVPTHKITITRSDGTVDDITDIANLIEVEDGVTDTIGLFKLEIWNPNETYTRVWTGMEIVRYYCDYNQTAESLRFRGRVERVSYQNNKIIVNGRSESLTFLNVNITKSYDNVETSVILKDLITNFAPQFTITNITESTTNVTKNWIDTPFWDAIKELCVDAGFDCYLDAELDMHYFRTGSVLNTEEAIVHDSNLMSVSDFADDLTFVRNKIRVYGAKQDGIQILYTAKDTASQTAYGVREKKINNDNITDYTQASELGEAILANEKDPPQVGNVTGTLLASIQPGERIRLSSPENNIPPGDYDILSFKHIINFNRGLTTTVKVNKEPKLFSHIISKIINTTDEQQDVSINPEDMDFSFNFLFDSDSGSHTNTEISDGALKPTAGTGTWISGTRTIPANITKAYPIIIGTKLSGAIISVSGNGGLDYQVLTDKTLATITSATGTSLVVKVVFSDADTEIDSLSILYQIS